MSFGEGVGEGKGENNVSDQIEFEEQILGEMNDKKNEEVNSD